MSKRHQSSRRRSYGRRQHELHEREVSGATSRTPPELDLDGLRRSRAGRPVRLPRPARAAAPLRDRRVGWPSTRAPAPVASFLPRRVARQVDAPTLPRRRVRGAVRAKRRSNRLPFVLGGDRRRVRPRVLLARPDGPRLGDRLRHQRLLERERDALLDRKQELLTDLNRLGQEPAIRKLAIDAGLGQLADPLDRRRPLTPLTDRRIERCSDGPTRAAGSLLLLIVFAVVGAALARPPRVLAGRPARSPRRARRSPRRRCASETPSRRGDIYDRSGVVVLATTIERERLDRDAVGDRRRTGAAQVARELVSILGLSGDDADAADRPG